MSENEYSYPPDKWANEYTPTMKAADHISAADQRRYDHEKRISALELQVRRLLNKEPDMELSSDVTWQRGFEDGKAYMLRVEPSTSSEAAWLKGFEDGRAAALRFEGDFAHVPGVEWQALKEELETLRRTHGIVGSDNDVLMSHDAYDMLERQAAIGRGVPWSALGCCVGATGSMTGFFTLPLPPHGTLYSEEWKTFYLEASKWIQDSRPEEEAAE